MEHVQRRLLPSTAAMTAFDAVARLGSFSAAAAALDLTPGAISRQVDLLEAQLGVKLVLRTNKGISLTGKGQRYAESAKEIIKTMRLMSLEAMASNTSSTLRLAILPTFGTRWLLPRMPEFLKENPGITVNFATRIGKVDFEEERLDAAIHVGEPDWAGCQFKFLMRETVAPVCSPDFLAENPIKSPDMLLKMPLLEMASRPNAWHHWFASLGIEASYREGMRFEQFMHVSQACSAGLGVALMPLFLIAAELANGQLARAFDWSVESPSAYYFAVPSGKLAEPQVARFSDWLSREVTAAGF
jgi:LysR family transcriptional regulator, glycine cleavage system transcriptional activator